MWITDNPDKTSNLFFFLATATFLIPMLAELTDKKYRDRVTAIERRLKKEGKSVAKLRAIKEQFDNERFGGYFQHRRTLIIGVLLTAAGAWFLGMDIVKGKS